MYELAHRCVRQCRHAFHGLGTEALELFPVGVDQLEGPVLWNPLKSPGLGIQLVAAHHEAAHLLFHVHQPIGVAQGRQSALDPLDGLGQHELMLDGLNGNADSGQGAELPRPQARAVDQYLAAQGSFRGPNPGDPAILDQDLLHGAVLKNLHALGAGTLGQSLGDVRGASLPIAGHEGRTHDVGGIHQGPQVLSLPRRQEIHLQPKAAGGGGLTTDLRPTLLIARQSQPPTGFPACSLAGLRFQPAVQLHAVLEQLGDAGGGAQLPHKARRVEG